MKSRIPYIHRTCTWFWPTLLIAHSIPPIPQHRAPKHITIFYVRSHHNFCSLKFSSYAAIHNIAKLFLSPTCFCACLYRLCYCNVKNTYTRCTCSHTNLPLSTTCFCACLCYCNVKNTYTHYSRQHHQSFPFTHLLLHVPLPPLLLQRQKYLHTLQQYHQSFPFTHLLLHVPLPPLLLQHQRYPHTLQQATSPSFSFHPPASARASAASATATSKIPTHTPAGNITNLFLSPTCFCACLCCLCCCTSKGHVGFGFGPCSLGGGMCVKTC